MKIKLACLLTFLFSSGCVSLDNSVNSSINPDDKNAQPLESLEIHNHKINSEDRYLASIGYGRVIYTNERTQKDYIVDRFLK